MGYYDYQSGLIYRHLNQESGWDSHLDNCRKYILRAIDLLKPRKVTVLGSGWLLELPVAEIVEKTGKVELVDIIHPPDVVRQAGEIDNVELIESDVTGGLIENIWRKIRSYPFYRKADTLDGIVIPEYRPLSDPGLIISLNLITQLEVLPVRYLKKKARINEEEMYRFRRTIQERHIELLSKYNSVLITDYEEVISPRSGEPERIQTLLADLPPSKNKEKWTWDFDLKGVDYYNSRSVMHVIAVTI